MGYKSASADFNFDLFAEKIKWIELKFTNSQKGQTFDVCLYVCLCALSCILFVIFFNYENQHTILCALVIYESICLFVIPVTFVINFYNTSKDWLLIEWCKTLILFEIKQNKYLIKLLAKKAFCRLLNIRIKLKIFVQAVGNKENVEKSSLNEIMAVSSAFKEFLKLWKAFLSAITVGNGSVVCNCSNGCSSQTMQP